MVWQIKFTEKANKAFSKLDKAIQRRVLDKLKEISKHENPKDVGKALVGNLSGLWRYRVGDYRIVCSLEQTEIIILVVDIDHRRQVYN